MTFGTKRVIVVCPRIFIFIFRISSRLKSRDYVDKMHFTSSQPPTSGFRIVHILRGMSMAYLSSLWYGRDKNESMLGHKSYWTVNGKTWMNIANCIEGDNMNGCDRPNRLGEFLSLNRMSSDCLFQPCCSVFGAHLHRIYRCYRWIRYTPNVQFMLIPNAIFIRFEPRWLMSFSLMHQYDCLHHFCRQRWRCWCNKRQWLILNLFFFIFYYYSCFK